MAEIKRLADYILLSSGIILFINLLIPKVKDQINNGNIGSVIAVAGAIIVLGVIIYWGTTVLFNHFRDVVFTIQQTNIYLSQEDEEEGEDYE
jgi:hypothetical protein